MKKYVLVWEKNQNERHLYLPVWGIYIKFLSPWGSIHITKSSVHVETAVTVSIVASVSQNKDDKEQLIIAIIQQHDQYLH